MHWKPKPGYCWHGSLIFRRVLLSWGNKEMTYKSIWGYKYRGAAYLNYTEEQYYADENIWFLGSYPIPDEQYKKSMRKNKMNGE